MGIPFYYNPATNELELTSDPSPLRDSLGKRFGLNEISTARNTLSPTKSYAQKPPYNWEQGNWWDPNDQSVGGTQILEDFDHTTATMHKDGGRIDMKPGGLVEPGVTHYGVKRGKTEALLIRDKAFKALKKVIDSGELLEFDKLAKSIKVPVTTLRRVYDESFAGQGVVKRSGDATTVITEIIESGVTDSDQIKKIAKEKYKINLGDRNISKLVNIATDVSVENYLDDFKKMASDSNYEPKHIKPATETGMTSNQIKAKKIAKETIEGFEKKYEYNIYKRKKLKRVTDPEKKLMDLITKKMSKTARRFKKIGKISLSKTDLIFNRAQTTILKLANELINSNPEAVLKDKALLEKLSYRIDSNGNIIKIKPDITKLIDPKADARFFHLGHGKRVELGGELLDAPANRNAVPFSLNMNFTKDAEKFIEANYNKPEMKSKIDKIIAKAKELKIPLRPDVPKGTFKNASGNPIRFIGYQPNAHPILKVLDVVKTYMPKGLRASGRLKIPATILALTTTSAKSDTLEPSDKTQEDSVMGDVAKGLTYGTLGTFAAKYPQEIWEGGKKTMRFGWRAFERGLMPFFSALHYAIEGKWPDPTKTEELLLFSFWNKLMKKYKWGHKSTDPIRRKLLNFLKRVAIPPSVMPLVSKIAGWGMIPAELYQGHKALTNISEKEKKIVEIATAKWKKKEVKTQTLEQYVNKVINMYRYAHNKFGFNREWLYKPLYRDLALSQKLLEGKTKPEFAELWLKNKWKDDPEFEEIKKFFDNDYIAKFFENKKRGELRRAKHYINEKSKYYVPFPTSKQIKNYKLGQSIGFSGEEDVMKGSVIDKDDLATGGIASLLK